MDATAPAPERLAGSPSVEQAMETLNDHLDQLAFFEQKAARAADALKDARDHAKICEHEVDLAMAAVRASAYVVRYGAPSKPLFATLES